MTIKILSVDIEKDLITIEIKGKSKTLNGADYRKFYT